MQAINAIDTAFDFAAVFYNASITTDRWIRWGLRCLFRTMERILGFLTSRRATRFYRWGLRAIAAATMTIVALILTLCILLNQWLNALVEASEAKPRGPLFLPAAPEAPASDEPIAQQEEPRTLITPPALTVPELRKLCGERGIKWRNAYGKNRHLPQAEMLALLMDTEAA